MRFRCFCRCASKKEIIIWKIAGENKGMQAINTFAARGQLRVVIEEDPLGYPAYLFGPTWSGQAASVADLCIGPEFLQP